MDLSIIIPARNEEFLPNTIDDILKNRKGETEIIVILDGYWPDVGIRQDPRIRIIHFEKSVGQRAAVNYGAKLSAAKFIMKLDAHCSVDEGFDIKLMANCKKDWTVIPRMYNLHVFDWKCKACGFHQYQGPLPSDCPECSEASGFERVMVWKPRRNRKTDFARFDKDMKFAYWRDYRKRPEAAGHIADTMSSVGACFFMHRERFFDLGGLDENHGSWGQFGTEIACKSWLSGGRHVVNKKTWFAHLFRTNSKGFSFPYPMSGTSQEKARQYSQNVWLNDKWPGAVYKLSWLVEKFRPVPDWHDENDIPVKKESSLKKGIVYYTDNRCEERIAGLCRRQIAKIARSRFPVIWVSQFPLSIEDNIVMPLERSILSQAKQILAGLETIDADVVFLCEHDILYHEDHFDFIPPEKDRFFYNQNRWPVCATTGQALFYYTKALSHCCAYRELLIEHYKKRIEVLSVTGYKSWMGHSPGSRKDAGFGDHGTGVYFSKNPNIDFRHATNYTKNRFRLDQFRRKPKGWNLADEVPYWGETKARFDDFIYEVDLRIRGKEK